MSSDSVVTVKGLSKAFEIYSHPSLRLVQFVIGSFRQLYSQFWALKDINFHAKRGEVIGIIGRNGSGKSTLLQLICGTLSPTSGQIETKGRIAALLELGTGFNPEFTGRENVYLACALHGLKRQDVDRRFDKIAEFADIGAYMDRPVKTYSSGMFVRLAFSVIAHVDADILVVDEALAVGDAYFNQKCMRFFREFLTKGTIFFVSHDITSVVAICDRVIWLDRGHIRAEGHPKDVTEMYMAAPYESINDIAISSSAPSGKQPSFGKGRATILSVHLYDQFGAPLFTVSGGEQVEIDIICKINADIDQLIVGFLVNNRKGQNIFGSNTANSESGRAVRSSQVMSTKFKFKMPILSADQYVIAAAVAEGTNLSHIQHHWIHDAALFSANPKNVCHGIIGLPLSEHASTNPLSNQEF